MTDATSPKKIRILVIQLTRLGDTLQSLMALRAAKQLYPNLEIHFVAREKFSAAVKRVPWIESVITFPSESLLGPVLNGTKTEQEGLGDLASWLAPLVKTPFDFVVNWSYSESSSYLTALVPGRVKLGFTRRADLQMSCADGWSQYIQGVILNDEKEFKQNIHLTDILTTQLLTALQIHVGEPADEGDSPVTSKSFFALELGERDLEWVDHSRKWIAIQLGAGKDSKTWDPENWAKLAQLILKRHNETSIVLLGEQNDKARAEKFLEIVGEQKRVLSLVGQTDFDLWASIVSRAHWVFAADTAVIHLASVLGTRVLNVSIGPVTWTETGPYGNGHYVVSSANTGVDKENITPEAIYASWAYAQSEWSHRRRNPIEKHFSNLGYSDHLNSIQIHRSRIRNANDGGGVHYESLLSRPMSLSEWNSLVLGQTARFWYCGWVPPTGQELNRERISSALIKELRELNDSAMVLSHIWEEAKKAAISLAQKSSKMKSEKIMVLSERNEIGELGKKIQDLDALVARAAKTKPILGAFETMFHVAMHNLKGVHLSDVSRESAEAYQQLIEGIRILREWLKHTLEMAKPVALKSVPQPLTSLPELGPKN